MAKGRSTAPQMHALSPIYRMPYTVYCVRLSRNIPSWWTIEMSSSSTLAE
jgi:hypothetical protein